MRSLALALLLLVLPGLLLPAGMSLHVCRCEPRPEPRTCCASHAEPAAPAPACCTQQRDDERDPQPALGSDDCGCVWVPLTDEGLVGQRQDPPTLTPPGTGPPVALPWPPAPPANVRGHCVAVVFRPPPDHQRSLPLRL